MVALNYPPDDKLRDEHFCVSYLIFGNHLVRYGISMEVRHGHILVRSLC
jgi:hypothetical protein